jgi:RND family efflux transporter MFP subunit
MSRIALLLLTVACSTDKPPVVAPPAAPVSRPVSAAPVETYPGVVMSRTTKLVSAEVDGRIEKLLVQPGQRVTANTPLAVLDPSEVQKGLEAARGEEERAVGDLRRCETQRAEAGRQWRQLKSLLGDGAVSRDQVSSAQAYYATMDAQVDSARGAMRRAQAAREQAEQQLQKTTIVAPIDGVITLVRVTEGQMAGRGQPIARIFDPADLWVKFTIPPERRDALSPGVRVSASPTLNAERQLTATVQEVHRTLEPPMPFAVVEADLDDSQLPDRDTLVGAMVDVRIE